MTTSVEALGMAAILIAAAGFAFHRGQDVKGIVSWAVPAALLGGATAVAEGPIRSVVGLAFFGWLIVFSFSERIGQWWWANVLHEDVAKGVLPALDNDTTRMLEAVIEPAWREHKAYLAGRSSPDSLRARYASARSELDSIGVRDHEWEAVLETGRLYLDAMVDHLRTGESDFEGVHVLHDRFRQEWTALMERRRRPWRDWELF